MKKLMIFFTILLTLVLFTAGSFAEPLLLGSSNSASEGILNDVRYQMDGELDSIIISVENYKSCNTLRLTNPDRIVIDIPDIRASDAQQVISVNSSLIKTVRYAQFDNKVARIVIDVTGKPEYQIEKEPGQIVVRLTGTGGSTVEPANSDKGTGSAINEGVEPANRGSSRSLLINKGFSIGHSDGLGKEKLVISLNDYKNYNVTRLTGPDRIVVDIPYTVAQKGNAEKILSINSNLIKTVRYAQYNTNTARLVIDTIGQLQFSVKEEKGCLVLEVGSQLSKSIVYHSSGDRVYFTLAGAKLTEGGQDLKRFYTEKYDYASNKFSITFPSSLVRLNSGVININDGMLNSVEISVDKQTMKTSIIFNAKSDLIYQIFTRSNTNDTAITLLKPAQNSEKLIVIDPGHGGVEPGAVYKNILEKDLNLDIALRLNNLLKKKKIKTYIMREDDSFVGLYERANIANSLNARLFLSIHNNAMDNASYSGTMTLCYPTMTSGNSLNGKAFAQIIQSSLLSRLNTTDRKVIYRPELIVLKATTMPSALAEVAFMTNSKDRNNLQSVAFRQRAALALCDSVVKALKQIE